MTGMAGCAVLLRNDSSKEAFGQTVLFWRYCVEKSEKFWRPLNEENRKVLAAIEWRKQEKLSV